MITVINGKRYNTETADRIYEHWNGCNSGDFRYRTKTLYRTAKGAWFIHHVGGAMSDMSVPVGSNGRGGSERIEPVDNDDAFGLLQAHSDESEAQEAIDKHFAERVVDA